MYSKVTNIEGAYTNIFINRFQHGLVPKNVSIAHMGEGSTIGGKENHDSLKFQLQRQELKNLTVFIIFQANRWSCDLTTC